MGAGDAEVAAIVGVCWDHDDLPDVVPEGWSIDMRGKSVAIFDVDPLSELIDVSYDQVDEFVRLLPVGEGESP